MKHISKASGLQEILIEDRAKKVYGIYYDVKGNSASSVQFYLTDSTKHFIRGSLYFYSPPNKDSIAPVLDYLKKDIFHIAWTLKWKDTPLPDDRKKDSMLTPTFHEHKDSIMIRAPRKE